MSGSAPASSFVPLAILPNGEAVRPERVVQITIDPAVLYYDSEVARFDVVAHMVDGSARKLGERLLRPAAESLASDAAQSINRALQPSSREPAGRPGVRLRDSGGGA